MAGTHKDHAPFLGVANGIAPLDSSGLVPATHLRLASSLNEGRLSLHASDSVGEATSAGTLYFHRHVGDKIALYTGTVWTYLTIAATPLSLALSGGTASKPHDVWAYDNSGAVALELTAWTDDTTRATALVRQDGVWVKTGATTRRYLGTVYLDASKQATDAIRQRGLWNEAHPVVFSDFSHDSTDSFTNAGNQTWSAVNSGNSAWKHSFVVGRSGRRPIRAMASLIGISQLFLCVALDSTSTPSGYTTKMSATNTGFVTVMNAHYVEHVAVGYHYVQALHTTLDAGTGTGYGDAGIPGVARSGMFVYGER